MPSLPTTEDIAVQDVWTPKKLINKGLEAFLFITKYDITWVIKSRRMRWLGHIECMGN
jgi:hypothetical protein